MKITKHVGRLIKTDQRLYLIFTQLADEPNQCLICQGDGLPPQLEQAIAEILETDNAQSKMNFADALHGALFPGSGKSVLQMLHETGRLTKVPIDSVVMLPMPNMPIPLRKVLESIGIIVPQGIVAAEHEYNGFNPHQANAVAALGEEALGIARNLLAQATLLESDARAKRLEAYRMAPQLEPRAAAEAVYTTAAAVTAAAVATTNADAAPLV